MYKIILASQSPRRRQILERLSVPFEVIPSGAKEYMELEQSPYEWVKILSHRKASAVAENIQGPAVIIGADTVVTYLGKILNKPENNEEAASMLRLLSGKNHTVYTGLTLFFIDENGNREYESFVDATEVCFNPISTDEIEKYLSTGEYSDKAGGYAVQSRFGVHIEKIEGNYFTVVGLPIHKLYDMMLNIEK